MLCGNNSVCQVAADKMSGTCVPVPKADEPCVVSPNDPTGGYCGFSGTLHCDHSTTPPLCKLPGKAGSECISTNDCAGFAVCDCETPGGLNCAVRHCIELKLADQPCTASGTRCHPAFECTAGVCKALTLRGDFANSCGP